MNAQHMKLKWRTPSTMNTNHTSLYDGDDASGYTKPLFDIVGKGHEEKARHIADCVNACAGIVNPEIKIPQLKDALIESVEQLQKAEQQNAKLLVEVSEYRAIRDRLAAQDKAGTLPDDYSIYIGLLENRLSEQRNLNSAMEQQRDELLAAAEIFRDSVLHQRHSMADNGMTNDQVNDVLGLFDDTLGEAIAKAGVK